MKQQKALFKVNDRVKIIESRRGASPEDIGKTTTIVEIGKYFDEIGYKIDNPKLGNSDTGQFNGFIGESSFKLVESAPQSHNKYIGTKTAVQCKTQEEWDEVTKILKYEWSVATWEMYREWGSCIQLNNREGGARGTMERTGYKIISYEEFMGEEE